MKDLTPYPTCLEFHHQAGLEADEWIDPTVRRDSKVLVADSCDAHDTLVNVSPLEPITGLPKSDLAIKNQVFQELPI